MVGQILLGQADLLAGDDAVVADRFDLVDEVEFHSKPRIWARL